MPHLAQTCAVEGRRPPHPSLRPRPCKIFGRHLGTRLWPSPPPELARLLSAPLGVFIIFLPQLEADLIEQHLPMIETVDLHVEARDQDIVVTMPGTTLRVVYRKPHRGSQLV